jgi:hypothetical protein
MKVGAFFATHNNPMFTKLTLIQLAYQSHKPDAISIHVNGQDDVAGDLWANVFSSYSTTIHLSHSRERMSGPTSAWQMAALEKLVREDPCDIYFAVDHDNLIDYFHIGTLLIYRDGADIVACKSGDILILNGTQPFELKRDVDWKSINGMDWMASSVAFTHPVAVAFLEAMREDGKREKQRHYDRVFQQDIVPKFKMKTIDYKGVCFVAHGNNTTVPENWYAK